jgi:CheY-like chemotaxis protein
MAKKRVLLVDDEKSFTNLLKLNLEDTGNYEVRVENWAEDALKAAREFKPDIVLLDIIMPRMPGGNVAMQLKEDPALKDTPVIFLTAGRAPASD